MNAAYARGRVGGSLDRRGMSMIELIAVLAIVAIMTAVAVPTFAKLGMFSRDDLQSSARELHAMLKAARIYAATYRVDTAVAYGTMTKAESFDSTLNTTRACFDAAALVYKLPASVANRTFDSSGSLLTGDIYVPINMDESGAFFRPTKPDTAVLADVLDSGTTATPSDSTTWSKLYSTLHLYRVESNGVDRYGQVSYTAAIINPFSAFANDSDATLFPAHIFTPSGMLLGGGAERFKMYVGYAPTASPAERFVEPDTLANGFRTEAIEISHSTGRVQLVQE